MNWQFWLHPTPQQRKAWSWLSGVLALLLTLTTILAISRHRWGWAVWNGILVLWNLFFCHINYLIYEDWRKSQKGVDKPE